VSQTVLYVLLVFPAPPNDIEFRGERKRFSYNEGLRGGADGRRPSQSVIVMEVRCLKAPPERDGGRTNEWEGEAPKSRVAARR
jgi:hypothetical protein